MNRRNLCLLRFWGGVLVALGCFWLTVVVLRSFTIVPPHPPANVSSTAPSVQPKVYKRSPYVEKHHVVLFRVLAFWEVICAMSYVVTGVVVLTRRRRGDLWVAGTIVLDLFYKLSVVGYMVAFARPLQALTRNVNVLYEYYQQGPSWVSVAGFYLSGLRVFEKGAGIYYGVVLLWLAVMLVIRQTVVTSNSNIAEGRGC